MKILTSKLGQGMSAETLKNKLDLYIQLLIKYKNNK